jgi:hypothetical protein
LILIEDIDNLRWKEPIMAVEQSQESIRESVRAKYADRARRVAEGASAETSSCCGTASCSPITSDLYAADDVAFIPEDAVKASLGCGNPTALAELSPGETVLDLGSGGGIDVLLSAKRVGPTGFAYGLDSPAAGQPRRRGDLELRH